MCHLDNTKGRSHLQTKQGPIESVHYPNHLPWCWKASDTTLKCTVQNKEQTRQNLMTMLLQIAFSSNGSSDKTKHVTIETKGCVLWTPRTQDFTFCYYEKFVFTLYSLIPLTFDIEYWYWAWLFSLSHHESTNTSDLSRLEDAQYKTNIRPQDISTFQ